MAVPPNRMTAYQNARAAEAQPAPSTSILDLDPDAFVAALDELGLPAEERAFVEQQYFAQNRALPMTERPEGKRVGMVAPIAFPEGMTGAEALMSGDFEFTAPEFLRGMYEAPAEAANVAGATVQGVPVTEQQMQDAAQGMAEVMTGVGPARALVRGQVPDAATVSMSGARGMGDNGGPAMLPQRYINPNTGLYSPSFEAARALPQEVGTAEQMRAMLLRGGAKEEELVYSGFDDWLKGKDKVTKQEIEDVLGASAAGRDGNMPYARESYGSKGVVGSEYNFESQQDRLIQRLRQQAIEDRNARMESELLGRGYGPARFADENEYRQMADRVRAIYADPGSRGGLTASGDRLPPARFINTFNVVDSMMRRQGLPFDSSQVQGVLNALAEDSDFVVGPSGLPEFADEVIRRELPDFATNPYFGSLPMRDVDEIQERVYSMSEQDLADQFGISVEDMRESFRPGETEYGSYAPKGLKNYSENLYKFDDAGRGVLSGIEALGVRRFSQPHFAGKGGERTPTMFHTRTGELQTPDGPAYHLAEIQSDIGQSYQKYSDQFFVPGSTSLVPEITKQERQVLQNYVDLGKELRAVRAKENEIYNEMIENYLGPDEAFDREKPGFTEVVDRLREARDQRSAVAQRLMDVEGENWDFLYGKLVNAYQTPRLMSDIDSRGFSIDEYDPDQFEAILAGTAKPKLTGRSKLAALPFATSTNRWVDAALKNELINAAKSGAEWITLPMGKDVASYTFGDVEGQTEFYEKIVPRRLKELSKKFLDGAEIQQIEAKGFGPDAPTYRVNGIRLTPELRAKLLEGGLPSFAKGGPVIGSSLDVDVFAFP